MLRIRRAEERGRTRLGWLDGRHSFSFGRYHDPEHVGFRALRVINDDRVAPGAGFPMHPHQDTEIVTYVVEGALEHADSTGGRGVIGPGEVQRMTAGRGIRHSEMNASSTEPVRLLQIWIEPERAGLEPGYEQRRVPTEPDTALHLVAAPDGRDGALTIHQDVEIRAGHLAPGATHEHAIAPGRHQWLQVVSGALEVNDERLAEGDGAAASDETALRIRALDGDASLLLFDLA